MKRSIIEKKNLNTRDRIRIGRIQQKILLILMGGVALGLSGSPKRYFKILEVCKEDWKKLNNPQFSRSIESLHKQGLITCTNNSDGTLSVHLTKKGRLQIIPHCPSKTLLEQNHKWDGVWHIVMFDIPTEKNHARDSFRLYLKNIGFFELQRSIFVFPYDVRDTIDMLAAFHDVFNGVVYVEARSISNERRLKKHFKL